MADKNRPAQRPLPRPIGIASRQRRSTLAELRRFVEKSAGAPPDAVVTVRTSWWRMGNKHGAPLTRITAEWRPAS